MGLKLSSQVLLDNPDQLIMDVNKEMKIKEEYKCRRYKLHSLKIGNYRDTECPNSGVKKGGYWGYLPP